MQPEGLKFKNDIINKLRGGFLWDDSSHEIPHCKRTKHHLVYNAFWFHAILWWGLNKINLQEHRGIRFR